MDRQSDGRRFRRIARDFAFDIPEVIQESRFLPVVLRRHLLRLMGFKIGKGVRIKSRVSFFSAHVSFADHIFVNVGCLFDASAPITVESGVFFGPRVTVITSSHGIGPPHRRAGTNEAHPVVIGEGAWIGAGAIILPGAHIAPGCIVAAGAVVTRVTERNGVYAGVPARRVRNLE